MGTKNYNFQYINEPEHRRTDLVPETSKFLDQIDDALHGVSTEKGVSALESAVSGGTVTITGKDKAGATLTETEFKVSGGSYDLPTASADTLGGVKIGDNLSITSDGVLSASGGGSADINSVAPLKVDTAAISTYDPGCVAIGNEAAAYGARWEPGGTAVGSGAEAVRSVSGTGSVAYGYEAKASNSNTTALGGSAAASAAGSTAVGSGANSAGGNALALGYKAAASGIGSIAIGPESKANTEGTIVIGAGCTGPSGGYRSTIISKGLDSAPSAAIVVTAGYTAKKDLSGAGNSVLLVTSSGSGGYDAASTESVSIGNSDYSKPFRSTANYGVCIGTGAQTGTTTYADTANVAIGLSARTVNGSENIKQAVAIGDKALADEANTVSFLSLIHI